MKLQEKGVWRKIKENNNLGDFMEKKICKVCNIVFVGRFCPACGYGGD